LLIQRLSENLKSAKITIVLVLKSIKEWLYFLYFCIHEGQIMKLIKLALGHNCVHVCSLIFYLTKFRLSICHYTLERQKGVCWCYYLKSHLHSMFMFYKWNIRCFWFKQPCLVKRWWLFHHEVYLHLGVLSETLSCIRLGSTPPSICLCLVCKFQVLNLMHQCHFLCLFLLQFLQRSHILHWFSWWVLVRLEKNCRCHLNLFPK